MQRSDRNLNAKPRNLVRRRLLRGAMNVGMYVGLLWVGLAQGIARADQYAEQWGPAVGAQVPLLAAPDQSGAERMLADLSGDQGLLLFLNRSADW